MTVLGLALKARLGCPGQEAGRNGLLEPVARFQPSRRLGLHRRFDMLLCRHPCAAPRRSCPACSEVFGLQRFRECELIHGRWAMLACLGALVQEAVTGDSWVAAQVGVQFMQSSAGRGACWLRAGAT